MALSMILMAANYVNVKSLFVLLQSAHTTVPTDITRAKITKDVIIVNVKLAQMKFVQNIAQMDTSRVKIATDVLIVNAKLAQK